MIKKVNIILAVAFSLMLGLKGLKEIKDAREKKVQPSAAESSVQEEASSLAPCICYEYWAGYSIEDPISNRNGVLLDVMRAIFPKATFRHIHGNMDAFVDMLEKDPNAAVVGFGDHPSLKNAIAAPTPLMYCPLVLMTLRTNPWRYKGESSLDSLRILANEAFLDYKLIRNLHDRHGKDSPALRIVPSSVSKVMLADMVEDGEADAFVMSDMKNEMGAAMDSVTSVRLLYHFRRSEPIANEGTRFIVSGKDPELAKRMVDEYEKGLLRIEKSGELRRIFEYYGAERSSPDGR